MAEKKQTKLNKGKVFGCVLAVVICFMLASLVGRFYRLYQRSMELTATRQELVSIQEECDRIQQEIELLDDENYLTRYARENWVFTKEGEVVIPLPEDATSSKTDE